MAKYCGLVIYDQDLKKRYIIDHEAAQYLKKEGLSLILITYKPSTDHEYFVIHEILFGRILATHQNPVIVLKTISQYIYSKTNK